MSVPLRFPVCIDGCEDFMRMKSGTESIQHQACANVAAKRKEEQFARMWFNIFIKDNMQLHV